MEPTTRAGQPPLPQPDPQRDQQRGRREVAEARNAAEEEACFSHPAVPPDTVLAYGQLAEQIADFYLPPESARGGGSAPLVLFFHGGAWRAPYDRAHASPLASFLSGRGFAVASVEYRRGNGRTRAGRWPDTFDDLSAAADLLPALVREQEWSDCVDSGRVILCGHSAGGHAALWTAARHRLPRGSRWRRDAADPALAGVLALAPIADFATARTMRVCNDAVDQLLGEGPDIRARSPQLDPAALVPTGIPTTILHGATDIEVPPRVARTYVAAAGTVGQRVRLSLLPEAGHYPLIDPDTLAAHAVADELTLLAAGGGTSG
ncbi:alpha/beta hydrolase family protein [Phaeacidiphilus oryzae]|uniref:alpha/beta hydrolase family protein n=1 Tax=Phaeacidiphilus oryzae TaxID=348818 RepID=UPI0005658469|nr:alpha/beta hydrolase [Phaeacidiphilus oryzae]